MVHRTILNGHNKNVIIIGSNTWIGQNCCFHGAGGIAIGNILGIGSTVQILTSVNENYEANIP